MLPPYIHCTTIDTHVVRTNVRTHAEWRSFSVEIAEFEYLVRVTVGITIGSELNESNDLNNMNRKGVYYDLFHF